MAQIDITRSYEDGEALLEADLDAIRQDTEDFVNVTKLNDDNFQPNGIHGDTKLVDASITAATIAAGAINSSKIQASAITTEKIQDSAITDDKLAASSVTAAKIASNIITEEKFADVSVTSIKRVLPDEELSAEVNFTTTSTSEVDVTDATVTITVTAGKSVMLYMQKQDTDEDFGLQMVRETTGNNEYLLYRDSTQIAKYKGIIDTDTATGDTGEAFRILQFSPATITHIDFNPGAGTYTYKLAMLTGGGVSHPGAFQNVKLVAYEIV